MYEYIIIKNSFYYLFGGFLFVLLFIFSMHFFKNYFSFICILKEGSGGFLLSQAKCYSCFYALFFLALYKLLNMPSRCMHK